MSTGHFTQVVWNSSTKLGMGLALGSGKLYCVGQYSEPGNYDGEYQANVFPLGTKTTTKGGTITKTTTTAKGATTKTTTAKGATTTTTKSAAILKSVTTECLAAFRAAALSQHNIVRAKHGAKTMTQDDTVDASALSWAKNLASSGAFDHSKNRKYGENLYYTTSSSSFTLDICSSKKLKSNIKFRIYLNLFFF